MLYTGQNCVAVRQGIPLITLNCRFAEFRRQSGIFTKTFISPSPSFILRDSYAGAKGPVQTSSGIFDCRDLRNQPYQVWISCCPQSYVVWENSCSREIIMSVYGIYSINNGYSQSCR